MEIFSQHHRLLSCWWSKTMVKKKNYRTFALPIKRMKEKLKARTLRLWVLNQTDTSVGSFFLDSDSVGVEIAVRIFKAVLTLLLKQIFRAKMQNSSFTKIYFNLLNFKFIQLRCLNFCYILQLIVQIFNIFLQPF